ncbi:hypothetical protein QMK19_38575, partial [Streptomyces sp. H10-C2]|uniref:hypothetical protein n=1 Tax=unclassified Streptomyces TaxID=2593676 RepID=UPI0024BAEF50
LIGKTTPPDDLHPRLPPTTSTSTPKRGHATPVDQPLQDGAATLLPCCPVALWPLAAVAGVREVAWGVIPAVACVALGVVTRANKAVHVFEEGIVFTGMWGHVKQVGPWADVSVRVKRREKNGLAGDARYTNEIVLAGTGRFGFGSRQVGRSTELVQALAEATGRPVEPMIGPAV